MTDAGHGTTDGIDLRIFVRETRHEGRTLLEYEIELAGEPREVFASLEMKIDPHEYFTEFWTKFNELKEVRSQRAKSENRNQSLDGWLDKSASLTRAVVPEDLQERLWELKDDVESVQILSEEELIPWEFLQLLNRAENGTSENSRFWSEVFSLTRWHGGLEAASSHFSLKNIGYLTASADKTSTMSEEAEKLQQIWKAADCDVEEIPSDFGKVRQQLTSAKLDGIHIIGHGRVEGEIAGSVEIGFSHYDEVLIPEVLDGPGGNVGRRHPLVFFNTCHSARSGRSLTNINSWANKFIEVGAGAFIGASWMIEEEAASLFATSFYKRLLSGLPIGKSAKEARIEVKDTFPGDPTWLAYAVYAHPLAAYKRDHEEARLQPDTVLKSGRNARLAIQPALDDQRDYSAIKEAAEPACDRAKRALDIDYSQLRLESVEIPVFGFRDLEEAHDFGIEFLEQVEKERLESGNDALCFSIGIGSKERSVSTPHEISRIGPTGQILIDAESWSQLPHDRKGIYGAEETVRTPDGSVKIRRLRVAKPAPDEPDLVKLADSGGLNPKKPPYIGPDYFRGGTKGFFGRNKEIKELCRKIEANDYVMIYAPSGAGKSSLVHAGVPGNLDPEIVEQCILVRFDLPEARKDGPASLSTCIKDKLEELLKNQHTADEDPVTAEATVSDLLRRLSWDQGRERVLIIDQFESSLLNDDATHHLARERFFHELLLALQDFKIKLVMVFREEYLAKIKDLCDKNFSARFNGAELYLQNLEKTAALEVVRNHARMVGVDYEAGLARMLIEELSKNNHIAPVQLQVVCRMIWENLEGKEGSKIITSEYIVGTAGGRSSADDEKVVRRKLQEFIQSSVQQFYYRTLEKIEKENNEKFKVDIGLLHIGCMEFVKSSNRQDVLHREGDRIGRLPESIVKRLEDEYLIRGVERSDGRISYQLIHDTVAEAITASTQQVQVADWLAAKRYDKDPNTLLYALMSLEFLVKRYQAEESSQREEDGDESDELNFQQGLFAQHDGVLESIEDFQGRTGLFRDEAEFVLRCVLASGKDEAYLEKWAENIRAEYPDVFNRVLLEAIEVDPEGLKGIKIAGEEGEEEEEILHEKAVRIRRNSVFLAGSVISKAKPENESQVEKDIKESIWTCALEDEVPSVWQAATDSLARIEPVEFIIGLTKDMASGSGDRLNRIFDVFVRLGEITYTQRAKLMSAELRSRLDFWSRTKVFLRMWKRRLAMNVQLLLLATTLAAFLTPPFTASLRGPLSSVGLSQSQAEDSFFQGVFHSIAAGAGWAFSITIPLLLYWILFERGGKPDPRLRRRLIPAVVGGLGGLVGGLVASSLAMFVFTKPSLLSAGWLDPSISEDASFVEFLQTIFFDTGFGWIYPITGACVGAGVGLLVSSLACGKIWSELYSAEVHRGPLKGELSRSSRIALAIAKMIVSKPHFLWLLVLPVTGALLSYMLLDPGDGIREEYAKILIFRSLGDVITFFPGGIGLAIGIFYSFIVDATGFQLARKETGK